MVNMSAIESRLFPPTLIAGKHELVSSIPANDERAESGGCKPVCNREDFCLGHPGVLITDARQVDVAIVHDCLFYPDTQTLQAVLTKLFVHADISPQ
jgi:hypothetical protein